MVGAEPLNTVKVGSSTSTPSSRCLESGSCIRAAGEPRSKELLDPSSKAGLIPASGCRGNAGPASDGQYSSDNLRSDG